VIVFGRILTAFLTSVVTIGCTSGPGAPDQGKQLQDLLDTRAATERFMREGEKSPIPRDKREVLLPLRYFEPDPTFSTAAQLDITEQSKRPVAEMPTSTGGIERYERVGFLRFTLKGEQFSLGAFVPAGTQRISELFVPFADQTSGNETYAAGRYLNLEPTSTGLYRVDFNYAYNPYCAYNKEYECPYPPPSNRLSIPIRAGEKVPQS
jgi:uncharacterized protein (DUF1684 family)